MKWERKTINELCEIKGGKRLPKNHELIEVETNHPYIRARDIGNGIIDFSKPVYLQENTFNFISRYTVKADDIVLTIVGANIGDVGLIPKHLDGANLTENAVKLTSFNENCHFKYLLYYFLLPGKKKQLEQVAAGSAQGKLGLYKIKDIEVPIPPLPTQRKIASILSAYDDLIDNNLKRIKLLEEKAFLRYKQIVREEKLEKYILSDFGDIITGKTPSTTIADYFGDDVPFIKTPDMHNQIFIEHTDQMLSELGAKSQEKKFLPPLSLCVSCIGTAGVVGITSKPSQTNQQINSIVFNEPKNVYFFYALMSQMKEQLDALGSNGSTFTNVNKNKFENMEVFIPNQKVLNEFAEEFEPPFSLILTLQKQNTKLREARDILLPKLMNGQIEV